jgi:hypothetical protein
LEDLVDSVDREPGVAAQNNRRVAIPEREYSAQSGGCSARTRKVVEFERVALALGQKRFQGLDETGVNRALNVSTGVEVCPAWWVAAPEFVSSGRPRRINEDPRMQHIEVLLPIPKAVYRDSRGTGGPRELGIDSFLLLAVNAADARGKLTWRKIKTKCTYCPRIGMLIAENENLAGVLQFFVDNFKNACQPLCFEPYAREDDHAN